MPYEFSKEVIICEYLEDGKIFCLDNIITMNKYTYNHIDEIINKEPKNQRKLSKFIMRVLYKIDDALLIMYYKTKFKPFEKVGGYIGDLGNKINKENKEIK